MNKHLEGLAEGKKAIEKERNTFHDDWTGKCNYLNLSGIYDKLIKEAARCRYYASDLLIDIKSLERALDNQESGRFFFGFRDSGVDHEAFIDSRLESAGGDPGPYYRRILEIDLEFGKKDMFGCGDVECILYELWNTEG